MLQSVAYIIVSLIFSVFCGWFFTKSVDNITRIVMISLLICGLALLTRYIATFVRDLNEIKQSATKQNSDEYKEKQRKYHNLLNLFSKLFVLGSLLLSFGAIIVFGFLLIKEKFYIMTLFLISFLIAVIVAAYQNLKK